MWHSCQLVHANAILTSPLMSSMKPPYFIIAYSPKPTDHLKYAHPLLSPTRCAFTVINLHMLHHQDMASGLTSIIQYSISASPIDPASLYDCHHSMLHNTAHPGV